MRAGPAGLRVLDTFREGSVGSTAAVGLCTEQCMSQQAGTECGHIQSQQWPCSLYTLLPSCCPPTRGAVKENQLLLRGNPASLEGVAWEQPVPQGVHVR